MQFIPIDNLIQELGNNVIAEDNDEFLPLLFNFELHPDPVRNLVKIQRIKTEIQASHHHPQRIVQRPFAKSDIEWMRRFLNSDGNVIAEFVKCVDGLYSRGYNPQGVLGVGVTETMVARLTAVDLPLNMLRAVRGIDLHDNTLFVNINRNVVQNPDEEEWGGQATTYVSGSNTNRNFCPDEELELWSPVAAAEQHWR